MILLKHNAFFMFFGKNEPCLGDRNAPCLADRDVLYIHCVPWGGSWGGFGLKVCSKLWVILGGI